jgi:hypothetical protein
LKTNRRKFFQVAGLAGTGLIAGGLSSGRQAQADNRGSHFESIRRAAQSKRSQHFNMCSYVAPRLDKVRIGIIGLGVRGMMALERLPYIEGVEVAALSDKDSEPLAKAQQFLTNKALKPAKEYGGSKYAWKEMCENPDIDLIYICTPWKWHTPMAVYAMENEKHAATEIPAAVTIEEAWQLVETSERTRKYCMMLENVCYGFFELLTLNMARQGFFGEVIHVEGAYIHDLKWHNFDKEYYSDMWRLKENQTRNGSLYPTHGLGPVCQILNINRGDKMEFLTSMSGNDFDFAKKAADLAKHDDFYKEFATDTYGGNMNTTIVKTIKGKTILIQHDIKTTRPKSRIHLISGTKGIARQYPLPGRFSNGHEWLNEAEVKAVEEKYTPKMVKFIGKMAKKVGGHGGMDFIMDWRLVDCLRNGIPLDQDVYDAASWSVIAPLSEWSVANRSNSIDVPDFTNGAWKINAPVDIERFGA